MRSIRRRELLLALALAAIAGFLDAVGYLSLGGYFVSFMSGNTTVAAADASHGVWLGAGRAAGLIALFFVGVIIGAVMARWLDGRTTVLWAATAVLLGAALAHTAGVGTPAVLVVTVAMGMLNSTFQRGGEVTVGVTYMTGTLVKAGQLLVEACFRRTDTAWLRYAGLWLALSTGAMVGAVIYARGATIALWIAAAVLTVIAATTTLLRRTTTRPRTPEKAAPAS